MSTDNMGSGGPEAVVQDAPVLDGAENELGEGQDEALSTDEPAEKKVEAVKKSNKKKFKLKVDGEEFEEEIDMDDEEGLRKHLQLAKAAQKRMGQYSSLEKEVTNFLQELKNNPKKVLSDPRIGLDVKKLAAEIIEEEIAQSQKTPEQIEREELEGKLRKMEDERKREQEEFRQKEFERIQQQEFDRYDRAMSSALEKSNLPKSPYIIKKMADYMLMGIQQGLDVGPDDVLPLVQEEIQNDLKEMFAVAPDEVIEAFIGKDVINRMRKKNLAKKAVPPPLKSALKDSGQKAEPKKEEKKLTYKDFFDM